MLKFDIYSTKKSLKNLLASGWDMEHLKFYEYKKIRWNFCQIATILFVQTFCFWC